jgi:hypothetical protein
LALYMGLLVHVHDAEIEIGEGQSRRRVRYNESLRGAEMRRPGPLASMLSEFGELESVAAIFVGVFVLDADLDATAGPL